MAARSSLQGQGLHPDPSVIPLSLETWEREEGEEGLSHLGKGNGNETLLPEPWLPRRWESELSP